MQNHGKPFVQKLKDNAFYIALGLGLLAILAVIAVYTMERNGNIMAENDMDLNQASDYSVVTTQERKVEVTNGKTADKKSTTEEKKSSDRSTADKKEQSGDKAGCDALQEELAEQTTEKAVEEKAAEDNAEQIPVTSDVGELNFTSDKELAWPVKGDVILPYSMETTVYFKTLEQYQCNPGMLIAAGNGTTVTNAFLGKVTKVTSDNTYGNMVTLYLGNDYSIVYGQLDMIYVKEGDYVKTGASIGTVGTPTDSFKEEGSHLFFQMLEGEKTVNPLQFMQG
ncbi:MAG: M23 family metallopeptidase [Bacteroidales bacterium]|nr:M23 family metallopeptidase [Clostridium sp.]MCM1203679.1 M23 family metallopeptidase [Bacteroidales bacterium]